MKKICSVGGATQDIFLLYEGAETMHLLLQKKETSFLLLEQGTKIDIPQLHYATGGGATNAAVSFKRLGLEVEVFFKIGTDVAGQFVYSNLLKEAVGISHSITDSQVSTAISFIVPSIEHNHVALCYRGANTKLTVEEFPRELLTSCDYFYISPLSGRSALLLPFLARLAKEKAIPVAANPSMVQIVHESALLHSALPSTDIVLVNAYEAAHLMKGFLGPAGIKMEKRKKEYSGMPQLLTHFITYDNTQLTLFDYFIELFKRGPTIAVVTNGVEGVYVATPEIVYFHPSLKAEVVCGLGAGDAFSAAFVGSLALGKTVEMAIIFGVLNACSVIHFADAKQGLLTAAELERRAALMGTASLKHFPMRDRNG